MRLIECQFAKHGLSGAQSNGARRSLALLAEANCDQYALLLGFLALIDQTVKR